MKMASLKEIQSRSFVEGFDANIENPPIHYRWCQNCKNADIPIGIGGNRTALCDDGSVQSFSSLLLAH